MADVPQRVYPVVSARIGRPGGVLAAFELLTIVAIAGALVVGRAVVVDRTGQPTPRGAGALPVPGLAARAGDHLATALAGNGITFEIVQTSTIKARPGGPLVAIPDPTDRTKTIGDADAYAVGTLIERGVISADGYWLELLHGPVPGAESAFDATKVGASRQGLVLDGVQYRNDGLGWHETDQLPGIGLDPATIAKLPELLARAATAKEAPLSDGSTGSDTPVVERALGPAATELDADRVAASISGMAGPETLPVRALAADATVDLLPGIIATDLADDTELTNAAELRFDDQGRLVGLSVKARNLRLEDYDLVVDTLIVLRYPTGPPSLPQPQPRYVEPAADGEAER